MSKIAALWIHENPVKGKKGVLATRASYTSLPYLRAYESFDLVYSFWFMQICLTRGKDGFGILNMVSFEKATVCSPEAEDFW